MPQPESTPVQKASSRRNFLKVTTAAAAGVATAHGLSWARAANVGGSDTIRIGLIGCGARGPGAALNAMNVDPGVRLVAMTDIFLDRVKSRRDLLKKRKPDQVQVDDDHCFHGLDGYKNVLDNSDVVLIACSAKYHPFYLLEAIKAGKHVFVEKPHGIDPTGIREVSAACDLAKQKKLSIQSGLQSRYDAAFREAIKMIHDGAIGEIVSIEENFLRAPYQLYYRQKDQKEVVYQFSNQYHFSWLSGDDVTQSLVHNVDRATWAMNEQTPVKAHGLAGRSSSFGDVYGDVFDHHSVIYEYANGARMYAFCRTQNGCYNEYSSTYFGTKGRCYLMPGCRIEGTVKWKAPAKYPNPYEEEHRALFAAIRSGNPINAGDYMARSTQVAVMGQLACYSGQELTWDQVSKSNFTFLPKVADVTLGMEPTVKPDAKGWYPVPMPGLTEFKI